jgi:predicted amidophosphoribosyltransferase
MLAEVMKDSEALNRHRFDFIVSVPSGRLPASRDYCAAQVLATELATITGLRYEGRILQKQKETIPQRELPLDSRLSNLRGAFCVRDNARLIGHQILLIDDIFTTGATADECAKVLMEAGAAGVRVLTVARGL